MRCEGITKAFQGVHAVNGAGFEVPDGQITALIGPNGAGQDHPREHPLGLDEM